MLTDETLKALIEAIIYVAPEPVTVDAIVSSLEGEDRERVKTKLHVLIEDFERPEHGVHIRPVAGGYKFSSKPEHHEVVRKFVKSLKPPVRLSKPALETLAVIAYRQPVTLPEIDQIRGVDCGGVIHTLLEKKLVVTGGRKNIVGRPILYRTSRDFLVHFGLKDLGDLPSLREFEEMARQALGADLLLPEDQAASSQLPAAGDQEPPAESDLAESPSERTESDGNQESTASGEAAAVENEEPKTD